jgi:hypothetical protein
MTVNDLLHPRQEIAVNGDLPQEFIFLQDRSKHSYTSPIPK